MKKQNNSDTPFQDTASAKAYDATRKWLSGSAFSDFLRRVLTDTASHLNGCDCVTLVEGGVGTGRFAIPLLHLLPNYFKTWSYVGVDRSSTMLDLMRHNLAHLEKNTQKRITLVSHDLDNPMPAGQNHKCDVFILASVVQYLHNVRRAMDNVLRAISDNGVVWIAWRDDSWIQLLNGNLRARPHVDKCFSEFVRAYHRLRAQRHCPLPRTARLQYDPELAVSHLVNAGWHIAHRYRCSLEETITMPKLAESIEYGLNTGTALGISPDDRREILRALERKHPIISGRAHSQIVKVRLHLVALANTVAP